MIMKARKTVLVALFSCMALSIYALEMLIPPIVPVPGIKLGLSNVVVLVALYILGRKEAFLVLILRIGLSFLIFGQAMSFLFSLGGGLLCFFAISLSFGFLDKSQIWAVSMLGAVFHSLGQIIVAVAVTSQPGVAYYFLFMLIFSLLSGLFTGLCAKYSIRFLEKKVIHNRS